MQYAGLIKNDFAAAPGVCVTFFVQGCPHRCPGCHNPETFDFNGGEEFTPAVLQEIADALVANGIKRNLCIMGGEPLCQENQFLTLLVINSIKEKMPDVKVYLWTGYEFEKIKSFGNPKRIEQIIGQCEAIVDGPYIQELRDVTLPMRGSSNQRILYNGKDYFVDNSENL